MYEQPQTYGEPEAAKGSNGFGVAGFVVSLVAFCVGGLLSPISLILSLIGLTRAPRGFAIAGLILSLIGCVVLSGAIWLGNQMLPAFRAGSELAIEHLVVTSKLEEHAKKSDGQMPADLSSLGLSQDEMTDPWGNAYVYQRSEDGKGWTITSSGMDKQAGTEDDVVFKSDMTSQQVNDAIAKGFEAFYKKKWGAPSKP